MKTGRSVGDLAHEIVRQAQSKRDYIVDTGDLWATPASHGLSIGFKDDGAGFKPLVVGPQAHQHLSTQLGIPMPYYRKMQAETPELLADNVNTWMGKNPAKRMMRTLDGEARAFMSD